MESRASSEVAPAAISRAWAKGLVVPGKWEDREVDDFRQQGWQSFGLGQRRADPGSGSGPGRGWRGGRISSLHLVAGGSPAAFQGGDDQLPVALGGSRGRRRPSLRARPGARGGLSLPALENRHRSLANRLGRRVRLFASAFARGSLQVVDASLDGDVEAGPLVGEVLVEGGPRNAGGRRRCRRWSSPRRFSSRRCRSSLRQFADVASARRCPAAAKGRAPPPARF